MPQNHLVPVMLFLTQEPPAFFEAEAIRDEVVKVLRTLAPFEPQDCVRGQYVRGTIDGEREPGYLEEDGVSPDSETETFVAIRARIDNWRWADVPVFLRTGKRLTRRATQVVVALREAPAYLFDDVGIPRLPANHLHLRIQPDEGISLAFQAKEPGTGVSVKTVRMEFAYGGSFLSEPARDRRVEASVRLEPEADPIVDPLRLASADAKASSQSSVRLGSARDSDSGARLSAVSTIGRVQSVNRYDELSGEPAVYAQS